MSLRLCSAIGLFDGGMRVAERVDSDAAQQIEIALRRFRR